MRIDAHQHFWRLDRGDYGWLTPEMGVFYRDFEPEHLRPLLEASQIEGTVLVQAAPTLAETEYLLTLAEQHSFIKGVVGWVDFDRDDAPSDIARLAAHPALVGLRPMIQDIPDPDWMLRPDLAPAFEAMIAADLTFDALTLPRHLGALKQLLRRYPELRSVIDHGSKPRIAERARDGWFDDMAELAETTNAYCKFSGLVTEAGNDWGADDLRPYSDHLLATFGAGRLIWGSDWPVCTLAASYQDWITTAEALLAQQSDAERRAIFGLNAISAYGLE
ncbi:MAG: amidohydrolase family protein [Maritimibacter sp.]